MRDISICDRNMTDRSICRSKLLNKTMAFDETRGSAYFCFLKLHECDLAVHSKQNNWRITRVMISWPNGFGTVLRCFSIAVNFSDNLETFQGNEQKDKYCALVFMFVWQIEERLFSACKSLWENSKNSIILDKIVFFFSKVYSFIIPSKYYKTLNLSSYLLYH